jgi:hypothetical protein
MASLLPLALSFVAHPTYNCKDGHIGLSAING